MVPLHLDTQKKITKMGGKAHFSVFLLKSTVFRKMLKNGPDHPFLLFFFGIKVLRYHFFCS